MSLRRLAECSSMTCEMVSGRMRALRLITSRALAVSLQPGIACVVLWRDTQVGPASSPLLL